jgi:hypothetical protein
MKAALDDLRRAMEESGRDPSTLHVVPMGVLPDPEKLAYYDSLGVTEAALRLPSAARDEILPILDDFAQYLRVHS